MNKPDIPVIFTHFNQQPNYLKFALESAASFNEKVVLIGDESNKLCWKNHWNTTPIESYKYQHFQKNYVHMSTNPQQFEIFCFKRFFYLEEWMKTNDAKQAFLLDSDIMTFSNYTTELSPILLNDYIASLMTCENQDNFRWASSPHFSYWTLEALEDFTSFCREAYGNKEIREKLEQKFKWQVDNNQAGGICDMTLLYLWSKDKPKIANLSRVMNGMTVEHCINISTNYFEDEYQMQMNAKKITFKNGVPYGFNKVLNQEIRFLCIHCQGASKGLMKFFYYQNLRDFYLVGKLIEMTKTKIKFLIQDFMEKK